MDIFIKDQMALPSGSVVSLIIFIYFKYLERILQRVCFPNVFHFRRLEQLPGGPLNSESLISLTLYVNVNYFKNIIHQILNVLSK